MGTEITTETGSAPRALQLRTFPEFIAFGEFAANSAFAPTSMRGKPADCTLATILGMEIGLGAMAALQGIAVVNGKPSVFGDAMKAVVMASPLCEWIDESIEGDGDNMVATCRAQRRGYPNPTVYSFSMADAKRAGLTGKDPWKAYPRRMLQMRARGFCLRDAFPDLLRGIISREEAEDYPTESAPEHRPASPIQQRTPQALPAPAASAKPAPKPRQPRAAKAETVDAAPSPAAEIVQAEGVVEKALAVVAGANSADELADYQIRADEYLMNKKITKEEHDSITQAIDERADFLRSKRTIGGLDVDSSQSG